MMELKPRCKRQVPQPKEANPAAKRGKPHSQKRQMHSHEGQPSNSHPGDEGRPYGYPPSLGERVNVYGGAAF